MKNVEMRTVAAFATEEASELRNRRRPALVYTGKILIRKGAEEEVISSHLRYEHYAPEISRFGRIVSPAVSIFTSLDGMTRLNSSLRFTRALRRAERWVVPFGESK